MIEQDYILRHLQEFMDALADLLSVRGHISTEEISPFYTTFLNSDRNYFIDNDIESILSKFESKEDEVALLVKLEILAKLLYQDAISLDDELVKQKTLEKSLFLFKRIEKISTTFSLERSRMIEKISNLINEQ